MAIYQTNVWTCEICGYISFNSFEVGMYDDPVICPPDNEEWDFVGDWPNEKLACPDCLKNHKNKDD